MTGGGAARARRFGRRALTVLIVFAAVAPLSACASSDALVAALPRGEVRIAGGTSSGLYGAYATGLAEAVTRHLGVPARAVTTEGSVDNLLRVGNGEAEFGFAQGDTATDAVAGVGAFTEPLPVVAAARVYDERVHVVVPADAKGESIADLRDARVSIGATNSGVQVIAKRLLEAADIGDEITPVELGLEDSLTALQTGRIDAFFWVGGVPTPGIDRMAAAFPIKLLEVAPDIVERVNAGHAGVYRLADFQAETYGVHTGVTTMAVPNYLVVGRDVSDRVVHDTVQTLFGARQQIALEVPAAGLLDRREAIFTEPVDLHPGAQRFYVESRN